jgi:DnaK suppressor protein
MTELDRQTIETALDERLEELRRTRAGMQRESEGGLSGEVSHVDNHPGDEATETHERELEVTTELFLEEEERRIGEARRALAEGRYGRCLNCGRRSPGPVSPRCPRRCAASTASATSRGSTTSITASTRIAEAP